MSLRHLYNARIARSVIILADYPNLGNKRGYRGAGLRAICPQPQGVLLLENGPKSPPACAHTSSIPPTWIMRPEITHVITLFLTTLLIRYICLATELSLLRCAASLHTYTCTHAEFDSIQLAFDIVRCKLYFCFWIYIVATIQFMLHEFNEM